MKKIKNKKIYKILSVFLPALYFLISASTVYANLPSSANYQLQNYSFGAGGTTNSTSSNYGLNGVAGEVEFGQPNSANYQIGSGLSYMMKANVPGAPTLSTPANNNDRILFDLNTSSNP